MQTDGEGVDPFEDADERLAAVQAEVQQLQVRGTACACGTPAPGQRCCLRLHHMSISNDVASGCSSSSTAEGAASGQAATYQPQA